jgi:hypothetical protein
MDLSRGLGDVYKRQARLFFIVTTESTASGQLECCQIIKHLKMYLILQAVW